MSEAPIFVIGAMRSGTTLLRLVLDSHERIAIGPESGFMRAAAAMKNIPTWDYGEGWYRRFGWSDDEMNGRIQRFFGELFERYAAEQGKARWGEKTPLHVWHLEDMATLFPEAVFVAIVRHPGAVAHSMSRRWHYTTSAAADSWVRANTEIVRVGSELGDRIALCRYEDVVLEPEPTLRRLVHHLGEAWSDTLLRHHEIQRAKGTARVVDGGTQSRRAIDDDAIRRWPDALPAADQAHIWATAAPLAALFGYARDEVVPRPGGPWPVALGPDLRNLRDGALQVDFTRQREVQIADAAPEDLAERLARVEAKLERMQSRRSVRVADAAKRAKRAKNLAELRAALGHALSR